MSGIMIQEDAFARPSDKAYPFVEGILETAAGPVPRVRTSLDQRDRWGTIGARVGTFRMDYAVLPGLYCVGNPDQHAPVLVTANYKLTFDTLRQAIDGLNVWILVLDTKGINVWCAAGKGTFSATEVVRQVKLSELGKVVCHRKLLLPQLGATGVSGREVKEGCGFRVIWGPIRAGDIRQFIDGGMTATPAMKRISFPMMDRVILIPIELRAAAKPLLWVLLGVLTVSVLKNRMIALEPSLARAFLFLLSGILSGAVVVPILLPWIPGRAFSFKGAVMGLAVSCLLLLVCRPGMGWLEMLPGPLIAVTMSSFLSMNFTGSTPFTSPSGVEKEMRIAIPLQLGGLVLALGALVWAFLR